MTTMTAAVLLGPGKVECREVPVPEAGQGEVLVRVCRVGICGTDLEMLHGTASYLLDGLASYPWIFGHEWVGRVVALGPGATGPALGTRVVGRTMVPCGGCERCRSGLGSLCVRMRETGLYGLAGAAAEYLAIPASAVVPVPDEVTDAEACLVEPAVTVVRSLRDTRCGIQDRVAVVGTGTIGLLAVQLAARLCGDVTAIGVDRAGLALAADLGAGATLQSGTATSHDYSLVVEASGAVAGFREALRLVATGGRVAAVGVADGVLDGFPAAEITLRGIAIQGIRHGLDHYDHTIGLFERGILRADPLLHGTFPLTRVHEAFAVLEHGREGRPKVALSL